MKINSETLIDRIFGVFSLIPLDVEGSNIDFVGWIPSEEDKKYMPLDVYESEKKNGDEQKEKVLFKNVKTLWESCDCGGDYPCSHGSYVYAIEIKNGDKTHELSVEPEYICFDNDGKYGSMPIPSATIFDFIRMCQLCEIELELSDYAVSLLDKQSKTDHRCGIGSNVVCCDSFKKFIPQFKWFKTDNGIWLMPYIQCGEEKIRIIHCPSCGKYVREIQLSEDDVLSLII